MTKYTVCWLLIAFCVANLGCADPKDRDYFVAHGFKRSPKSGYSYLYLREHVRLADAARDLGFPLLALRSRPSGPWEGEDDHRTVQVGGRYFVVEFEAPDKQGPIVEGPLDDPNAVCTVSTSIERSAVPNYIHPTSSPRIRIQSVVVPKYPTGRLEIEFELAAEGNTPLVVETSDIVVGFTKWGRSPKDFPPLYRSLAGNLTYSTVSPGEPVVKYEYDTTYNTVSPGKPVLLTATTKGRLRLSQNPISADGGTAVAPRKRGDYVPRWNDLPPGEYALCVGISSIEAWGVKSVPDYYWAGIYFSEDYKLVVK